MEIIPVKRKRPQHKRRLKIPKFINPNKQITSSNSTQKVVKPADMFEPVQRGETKNLKIELKMVDKLLDASNKEENTDSNNAADGGFGLMFPLSKPLDLAENSENTKSVEQEVITSNQLANNRISANGKNYYILNKTLYSSKYNKKSKKEHVKSFFHYILFIIDQRLLPVFKNYHPGKPSNRLYIKNLTKQVEEKDLHFIYRKYIVPELKTEFE